MSIFSGSTVISNYWSNNHSNG